VFFFQNKYILPHSTNFYSTVFLTDIKITNWK